MSNRRHHQVHHHDVAPTDVRDQLEEALALVQGAQQALLQNELTVLTSPLADAEALLDACLYHLENGVSNVRTLTNYVEQAERAEKIMADMKARDLYFVFGGPGTAAALARHLDIPVEALRAVQGHYVIDDRLPGFERGFHVEYDDQGPRIVPGNPIESPREES